MDKRIPYFPVNDATGTPESTVNLGEVQNALKGQIDELKKLVSKQDKEVQEEVTNLVNSRLDAMDLKISSITVHDNRKDDPNYGYKHMGEFLVDVRNYATEKKMSERLSIMQEARNAVGSDEHSTFSDPHGGFLIPEKMLDGLKGTDPFAIQADTGLSSTRIPMDTQTVKFNARVDKDHSSSVTGGFRVYRRSEANAVTSSRGTFEQIELRAEALDGIAYATEEQVMFNPSSIPAIIQAGFNTEWRSTLNDERIRGNGVGRYLGVLNSPALISIAKEDSQTADTINGENVTKMRARCWGYGNAVWMVNQDCYSSISKLHRVLTTDDLPVFVQGNGIDVPDTILGRPVVYDENMSTLGDLGDIMLINWSEYLEGQVGGTSFRESIHVRFVERETTYQFGVYNAGAPWWRTALTPKNSADTLSPFVALAARA